MRPNESLALQCSRQSLAIAKLLHPRLLQGATKVLVRDLPADMLRLIGELVVEAAANRLPLGAIFFVSGAGLPYYDGYYGYRPKSSCKSWDLSFHSEYCKLGAASRTVEEDEEIDCGISLRQRPLGSYVVKWCMHNDAKDLMIDSTDYEGGCPPDARQTVLGPPTDGWVTVFEDDGGRLESDGPRVAPVPTVEMMHGFGTRLSTARQQQSHARGLLNRPMRPGTRVYVAGRGQFGHGVVVGCERPSHRGPTEHMIMFCAGVYETKWQAQNPDFVDVVSSLTHGHTSDMASVLRRLQLKDEVWSAREAEMADMEMKDQIIAGVGDLETRRAARVEGALLYVGSTAEARSIDDNQCSFITWESMKGGEHSFVTCCDTKHEVDRYWMYKTTRAGFTGWCYGPADATHEWPPEHRREMDTAGYYGPDGVANGKPAYRKPA